MSVYREPQVPRDTTRLRVVTLNLWGLSAPLDRRLALAIAQLQQLDADVICLQEVRPLNGISGPTTADVLGDALGMHVEYRATMQWADRRFEGGAAAGEEGLAILSGRQPARVIFNPLPHARPQESRGLLSAAINVQDGPIWVHTTHLHYRLDDGLAREAQVVAVDQMIRNCGRNNDSAPQILCGDFNATPDSDEIRFLRGLTTLPHDVNGVRTHFQDAWLRLHREPAHGDGPQQGITWSSDNEHTRSLRSLDIDRRIDYVFVTSRKRDGRGSVLRCQVVMTEREGEGADAICASDHYGVMADIQIAATAT